jgi:Na+-driven multidrug efflux pump
MTAFCRLPVLLSLLYYLPHHWDLGINGLWYSFVVANVLEGLLKVFWFQTGRWKKTKV